MIPYDISTASVTIMDQEEHANMCRALVKAGLLYRSDDGKVMLLGQDGPVSFDRQTSQLGLSLFSMGYIRIVGRNDHPVGPSNDHFQKISSMVYHWARGNAPTVRKLIRPWAFIGQPRLRSASSGYDAATGTLSLGSPAPAAVAGTEKLEHLTRLFSGIYGEGTQQVRLLCSLIAVAARPATGEFPLLIVESTAKNSGKSRVAAAFAEVYGGEVLAEVNRLDQRLGGRAHQPGPNVFVFDNLRHTVASMRLSGAVSQPAITVEPKYRNLCPVYDPVFVLTMNAGRVEDDLADKAIFVTLTRQGLAPGEPAIMVPDPLDYARQHKAALLAEISSVLDGLEWPKPDLPVSRFVSWESLMVAIAGRLGVDLDLTMGQSRNQLVRELVSAYLAYGDFGKDVPLVDVVASLRSNRDAREANFFMSGLAAATDEQRAQGVAEWIRLHVADLPLTVGKVALRIGVQPGGILRVEKFN